MKKFLILAIAFMLFGCDECSDKQHVTRRGESYTPIKICAIGGDGDTCVEYQAATYDIGTTMITMKTLNGHRYAFNLQGWSIIITKE